MFQGFYNLASGILYQNRNLNVISNNMVNVNTPGYKSDTLTSTTFKDEILYRSGNQDKSKSLQIGSISMARAVSSTETSYEQGTVVDTGENLDFALTKPGFFTIQDTDGNLMYTRNGSFSVDDEGYLCLSSLGRVLGEDGSPIEITTDHINVDESGNIYEQSIDGLSSDEDGEDTEEATILGKIGVVNFEDYTQLTKGNNGTFTTTAEATATDGGIEWKKIERSNVDSIGEMTAMISGQRASQSAVQVLKMYDQLVGKIVTEVGKV